MAAPKWYLIAKNEYKIMTSSFPRFRYLFPFVVMGIIAFITGYLVPLAVNNYVTEIEAFIFSVAAVAVVQIILFLMFIYFLTFPISLALRDSKADQNEIFLSAPIKPSDVLLGKFVGLIPIYAIVITVIAGIFTAVLDPLGIDPIQKVIIVIIFIFTTLSGLWIGTVITAFLRTKLGKTARGRDIGKALGILIALPLVAIMYALMGGGVLEALANPNTNESVRNVFNIFPSRVPSDCDNPVFGHPYILDLGTGNYIRSLGLRGIKHVLVELGSRDHLSERCIELPGIQNEIIGRGHAPHRYHVPVKQRFR